MTKDGQGQGAAASSNRGASPNLVWGEQNAEELPKNCKELLVDKDGRKP